MKVILITGTGHCGSTLLDMLLSSHSKIVGIGEIQQIDRNPLCACGAKVHDCEFWREIFMDTEQPLDVARKKLDFLLRKNCFYFTKTEESVNPSEFICRNESIYQRVLETSGADVVVDSSKSVARAALLAQSEKIDLTIVHLVRDGRAVTWSYFKKYGQKIRFMLKWFLYTIKAEMFRRRYAESSRKISYKDLALKTENVLERILSDIDLSFEENMLDFRQPEHHQIDGNRMKFRNERISFDGEWTEEMPKIYKTTFELLLGWYNRLIKLKL